MLNRFETTVRNDADWSALSEDVLIPQGQRRTIMQLNDHTCRWPVGDPADPNFFFCGATTENGLVYCPIHRARAENS
jgi:GcrA cell cycle regulator